MARALNLHKPWLPEEDALLLNPPPELQSRRFPGRPSHKALADHLGRTSRAVSDRIVRLRLDAKRRPVV